MKIVEKEGKKLIFDIIRKKYVVLTPEEEVRQQLIHWLIDGLNYPKSSISVEKGIKVNERIKRYDVVIYKDAQPWILVETKAARVPLTQATFEQVATYNLQLQVPYLYITNGKQHFIAKVDLEKKHWSFLKEMPKY